MTIAIFAAAFLVASITEVTTDVIRNRPRKATAYRKRNTLY